MGSGSLSKKRAKKRFHSCLTSTENDSNKENVSKETDVVDTDTESESGETETVNMSASAIVQNSKYQIADYLTMTSEGKPKFTVAVAVDGSAFSKDALKFYLERLHKPDNQVLLVYANEPIARGEMMLVVGVAQYGSVSPDMWRRIMVQRQNQWKAMKQDIQSLIPAEVAYTWSSTEECGDAGEHIVQTAEQNGCSMIVVGTRGLGTIRRTILGSVSDYVVHHSAIPVFVCKHK